MNIKWECYVLQVELEYIIKTKFNSHEYDFISSREMKLHSMK